MMKNILVIEDDIRMAELIQRALQEHGFLADPVYDGISAQKLVLQKNYDLIIMDIILPKMDGIELCQIIRERLSDIPIIMLTALGTTNNKIEGFDAGADDYLVKPFEMRELLIRIRTLLKRAHKTKGNSIGFVLRFADIEMNLHTKIVKRGQRQINLTPKEFNLMEYMMQNPERVLSRTEIAEKVWKTYFNTGTNFIDVYINYLRNKTDKDFEHKVIQTKPGMGFILTKNLSSGEVKFKNN